MGKAQGRELDAWGQPKVFSPVKMGSHPEDVADTRWLLTWKEVEGAKTVKARFAVKGFQGPDLRNGNADIAGFVSRRSSQLQLISLGALKEWAIWSLDMENAVFRADGLDREVCVRAPCEWTSNVDRRVRRLRAPAYGFNDAPATFYRPLHTYVVNPVESSSRVGLRFAASSSDPRLFSVFRRSGGVVGAITTHIDDNLGGGEPDLLLSVRCFLGNRFSKLKVEGAPCVHVGVELAQENDIYATLPQEDFAKNLKFPPTSPELRAGRKEPPLLAEAKMRRRTFG